MTASARPKLKVSVVTPYYREPIEVLQKAHESVLSQDFECEHVLVADGHPQAAPQVWNCEHIVLPKAHHDGGSCARGIGALHAVSTGSDFVAFLDADCWFDSNHISSLVKSATSRNYLVSTSRRKLIRLDGTILDPCDGESNGVRFADTSTLMMHRQAVDLIGLWAQLPRQLGAICDLIIWDACRARRYATVCTDLPTLNFVTHYGVHYQSRGEIPPEQCISDSGVKNALAFWQNTSTQDRSLILNGTRAALKTG